MANFQTHLTASTVLGIGYGGVAYANGVPLPSCVLAGGLCSLSGMLPDIDSGPARPLREIMGCMGAMVPTLLIGRFRQWGLSQESAILAWAAIYVAIRFGLAELLQRFTVHRGMFHSLPAAAIFGELTFLLIYGDSTALRWFMAGAVVLGFMSHLVLDEVYSVQWDGRPRLKKSFGTALKLFGEGWWPNTSAYAKLLVATYLVITQPGLLQDIHDGQGSHVVQEIANDLPLPWASSAPQATTARPGIYQPAGQTGRAVGDNPAGFRR